MISKQYKLAKHIKVFIKEYYQFMKMLFKLQNFVKTNNKTADGVRSHRHTSIITRFSRFNNAFAQENL